MSSTSALIASYFPDLTAKQLQQFEQLEAVYQDWNAKINVISRKDMDQFYVHHVLHSLGIAKVLQFQPGTKVLDIGTGGGFPGSKRRTSTTTRMASSTSKAGMWMRKWRRQASPTFATTWKTTSTRNFFRPKKWSTCLGKTSDNPLLFY